MESSDSKIWQDPRFSHLVSDPRFNQLPKRERKVKIDKRFEGMFHEEKFKVKYTVDKYGRKVNKSSSEDLKKYYEIDSTDDDDEEEEQRREEKEIVKDESRGNDVNLNDILGDDGEILSAGVRKKLLESQCDYARGEGRLLTDSSSDEESSGDEDVFIEHVWGELDNDAPRTDESTRRLAACNMDWDRIRAVDIMVLCNSFLPSGGSILSVKIYLSEFGKERMLEEEVHGPPELAKTESDTEDELIKDQDSDVEEGDEYHMEKLRQYQLNRLKYYYAVIECDSVSTADKLYKECDGLEYESTATKLDLRFIPDDVDFADDEPREVCTELPNLSSYKPRIFTTSALYQAKVDLTWDENSIERKELSERLVSGKIENVNDAELRRYVACSSEDESGEVQEAEDKTSESKEERREKISTYKALLESINNKEDEENKRKFEMEYTWGINVEDKSKNKSKNKDTMKSLTPIEKILEKKREKNKLRKEARKKRGSEEDDESSSDCLPDGIDMNDPYFAEEFAGGDFKAPTKFKSKEKKSRHSKVGGLVEEEKEVKELELLVEDGEDEKQHFSLEKIQKMDDETKSKRKRKRKLRKSKHEIEATKAECDNFKVNVNDERFKALYTSHMFNIDPTNSHFKKTKGMEKIIQEKLSRRHSKTENSKEDNAEPPENKRPKTSIENRLLVKSLKRKIRAKKV